MDNLSVLLQEVLVFVDLQHSLLKKRDDVTTSMETKYKQLSFKIANAIIINLAYLRDFSNLFQGDFTGKVYGCNTAEKMEDDKVPTMQEDLFEVIDKYKNSIQDDLMHAIGSKTKENDDTDLNNKESCIQQLLNDQKNGNKTETELPQVNQTNTKKKSNVNKFPTKKEHCIKKVKENENNTKTAKLPQVDQSYTQEDCFKVVNNNKDRTKMELLQVSDNINGTKAVNNENFITDKRIEEVINNYKYSPNKENRTIMPELHDVNKKFTEFLSNFEPNIIDTEENVLQNEFPMLENEASKLNDDKVRDLVLDLAMNDSNQNDDIQTAESFNGIQHTNAIQHNSNKSSEDNELKDVLSENDSKIIDLTTKGRNSNAAEETSAVKGESYNENTHQKESVKPFIQNPNICSITVASKSTKNYSFASNLIENSNIDPLYTRNTDLNNKQTKNFNKDGKEKPNPGINNVNGYPAHIYNYMTSIQNLNIHSIRASVEKHFPSEVKQFSKTIKESNPGCGNRYQCNICQKVLSRRYSLIVHMRKHTGENIHECPICHKEYNLRANLKTHMSIHTGEKPFSCEVCHKQFRLKNNYVIHMRIHTGEKPFKCSLCNRAFSQHGSLKKHIMIHTDDRPHKCNICDKRFILSTHLKMHYRNHTGDKPYQCQHCDKKYISPASLTFHMRTHHK